MIYSVQAEMEPGVWTTWSNHRTEEKAQRAVQAAKRRVRMTHELRIMMRQDTESIRLGEWDMT